MTRKQSKHRHDFWAHLLADVLVRIGFFVATAVLSVSGLGYSRSHEIYDDTYAPFTLLAVLALSAFSALVGPWLYRTAVHRGRGSLRDVREESREDR